MNFSIYSKQLEELTQAIGGDLITGATLRANVKHENKKYNVG